MESRWGSWPAFLAGLLLLSASVLVAQESSATEAIPMRPPDAPANSIIREMYIPTTPGAPFSAKSVATLQETRRGSPMLFGFFTRTDPRWGKQTRRLTEISRGEPDPDYFAIPADYKMLDNRTPVKQQASECRFEEDNPASQQSQKRSPSGPKKVWWI